LEIEQTIRGAQEKWLIGVQWLGILASLSADAPPIFIKQNIGSKDLQYGFILKLIIDPALQALQ